MPSGAGQGNLAPLASEDQRGTKWPRRESKQGGKPWGKGASAELSTTAGGRGAMGGTALTAQSSTSCEFACKRSPSLCSDMKTR